MAYLRTNARPARISHGLRYVVVQTATPPAQGGCDIPSPGAGGPTSSVVVAIADFLTISPCHYIVNQLFGEMVMSCTVKAMERTTDIVKPYRVQLVHDADDRLIGVNIRATDGGEMDLQVIRDATRSLIDHLRREEMVNRNRQRVNIAFPEVEIHTGTDTLDRMAAAYREGHGRVTDQYLALLALAYSELIGQHLNVAETLGAALGGDGEPVPAETVRHHIKQARADGWLTPTTRGKREGRPTEKASQVLAEVYALADGVRPTSIEIRRKST